MQYVGKVGGYMYNQWTSLNPATLLGAIDIIVIERPDGSYHCSPFHVRFGKFQIIKPLQKKIDLFVNDLKTDLPMKLGDGGEGFFVFETSNNDLLSKSVLTSPVISPASSPEVSPEGSPRGSLSGSPDLSTTPPALDLNTSNNPTNDLDGFDLNNSGPNRLQGPYKGYDDDDVESKSELTKVTTEDSRFSPRKSPTPSPSISSRIAFEKAKKVTKKLNIPSKIDNNGDMVLDMDGYKPSSQKNISNSDEMLKKIFIEELEKLGREQDEESQLNLWDQIIKMDKNGNIRISNNDDGHNDYLALEENYVDSIALQQQQDFSSNSITGSSNSNNLNDSDKTYFKTLRLTSDQLKQMNLHYGENKLMFKLNQGNSQVFSNLYLWKSSTPIVISDIDGTITKSDALGHVLNFIGKDWTHAGVAKLFQDISSNGYNIVYLTARSVGQADSTRAYLQSIVQENGIKLPPGPVILSPDRTIAALRREVILKKPEVFKMSCLNDIKSLYYNISPSKSGRSKLINVDKHSLYDDDDDNDGGDDDGDVDNNNNANEVGNGNDNGDSKNNGHGNYVVDYDDDDDYIYDNEKTPFYAGFGNRITDAISYRSVNIPSHRIFTINPEGDVHMELLELSGVKSSYVGIGELVDQYFPPVNQLGGYSSLSNPNQSNFASKRASERFNDVNYWREPINLSDLSDIEDEEPVEEPKSPSLLSIRSFTSDQGSNEEKKPKERPKSISSFASPLKGFNPFNRTEPDDSFDYGNDLDRDEPVDNQDILDEHGDGKLEMGDNFSDKSDDTDDYDDDDDDDDDYDEEADEDYEDEDEDEDDDEEDYDDYDDDDDDYDDDDDELDYDSGLPETSQSQTNSPTPKSTNQADPSSPLVTKASDLMKNLNLKEER